MSKYDKLDPKRELEQRIADDLKRALEKRGLTVKHNGTPTTHAPSGKSDIEIFDDSIQINVEVTKRKKSSAEGEFLSFKDHLGACRRSF